MKYTNLSNLLINKNYFRKYSEKIYKHGKKSRREMSAIMDSLRAELDPILTPEQKERLKHRFERLQRKPFGRPGRMPDRHRGNQQEKPPH